MLQCLLILLLLIEVKLSLGPTSNGRAASNLNHRPLDNLIDLTSDVLNLVLAVQVPLNNLVSLNEAIELSL